MPFGNKAKPTRAYQFGAAVIGGLDALRDQLLARVRLWNELVALDHELRDRRDDVLDAWRGLTPAEVAARREELADLRRRARDDPDAKKALADAAYADRRARKPGYQDPDVKAQLATLDAAGQARSKELAAAAPLWWCNRDDVRTTWLRHRRDPLPLRFHRSADGGKVTVRRSGGWPVDDLLSGACADKGYVRLGAVDMGAQYLSRVQRRTACRTPLRLWVSTADDGSARFADLLVFMHRPLPAGGTVQQVDVTCERIADRWRWSVIFLVALPEASAPAARPGVVSLDLGYRRVADGLRVAVWRDDAGRSGEERLDAGWLAERTKVDDLRGIRDDGYNAARSALAAFLRARADGLPDWLHEETATIGQWRSPSRLARTYRRWQRFDGDAEAYAALAAWFHRDRHLWQYEAHLREQLILRRREQYRRLAAHLARTYGTVVIEEVDWSALARKPKRGQPATEPIEQAERAVEDVARRMRTWAAPSTLELAISNAVQREGGEVRHAPTRHVTATCAYCGTVNTWDHRELRHRCDNPACGREWDQDDNAARNLLRPPNGDAQTEGAAG